MNAYAGGDVNKPYDCNGEAVTTDIVHSKHKKPTEYSHFHISAEELAEPRASKVTHRGRGCNKQHYRQPKDIQTR